MEQSGKEQTRGQDVIIPARMFEEKIWDRLTGGERNVYVQLRRYSNKMGLTRMTLPGLAKKAGLTSRTGLRKVLVGLKNKGAIYKYFKPGDLERFLPPEAPKNTWIFYT